MQRKDNDTHREGTLTAYCQAVNYLLGTCAGNNIIARSDTYIMKYKQPENISAAWHSESLWEKALRCGWVYDESSLKGLSIEKLLHSIRIYMRNHCCTNKRTIIPNLALYVTCLFKLSKSLTLAASLPRLRTTVSKYRQIPKFCFSMTVEEWQSGMTPTDYDANR